MFRIDHEDKVDNHVMTVEMGVLIFNSRIFFWDIEMDGKRNLNVRFTMVLLKALSDQVWIRCPCFCFRKLIILIYVFYTKDTCAFLDLETLKKLSELKTFHIILFDQIKISRVPLWIMHVRFFFNGWALNTNEQHVSADIRHSTKEKNEKDSWN